MAFFPLSPLRDAVVFVCDFRGPVDPDVYDQNLFSPPFRLMRID